MKKNRPAARDERRANMLSGLKRSPGTLSHVAVVVPGLLDQVSERCPGKHYSLRAERACVHWVGRFIMVHGKCRPREIGPAEYQASAKDVKHSSIGAKQGGQGRFAQPADRGHSSI